MIQQVVKRSMGAGGALRKTLSLRGGTSSTMHASPAVLISRPFSAGVNVSTSASTRASPRNNDSLWNDTDGTDPESSDGVVGYDARLAMTAGMSEHQLQIVTLFEEEEEGLSSSSKTSSTSTSTSSKTSFQNDSSQQWTSGPNETLSSNLLAASYLYWRMGTSSSKYPITQKASTGSSFIKPRQP
jgi:hypothetical protein